MLVDVVFPIFAPTEEWSKTFEEMNYDTEKVNEKFGSPFVSNQDVSLKVQNGIYFTDLNPDYISETMNLIMNIFMTKKRLMFFMCFISTP